MIAADLLAALAGADLDGSAGFAGVLAANDLFDESSVCVVLAAVDQWAWTAPVDAARVAERCQALAAEQAWAVPTGLAAYVRARGAMAGGRIDEARALLVTARRSFSDVGDTAGAARTALGLAAIEAATGRLDGAREALTPLIDDPATDPVLLAKATQNLGAIEVMAGRYEVGLDHLSRCEELYAAEGLRHEWIDAVNNRAVALLGTGRAHDAIEAVGSALAQLDAAELDGPRAELLDTSARAHLLAGSFADAMAQFQESLSITRSGRVDERAAASLLGLADTWATLNLHLDAAHDYEAVAEWADANGVVTTAAWARLGRGMALARLDRVTEARESVASALAAFRQSGEASGVVNASLASASLARDADERDRFLTFALAAADPVERPFDRAFVELALHDAESGVEHLDAAEALTGDGAAPRLRYEIDLRRARVLHAAGDVDAAIERYRSASATIDATRGSLASERHRRSYLSDRLAAHVELVETLIGRGTDADLREAFDVAERARSRALLDAMAGLVERPPAGLASGAISLLTNLTRDLEALYNRALGDDELRGGASPSCDLAMMEARIESLRVRLGARPHDRADARAAVVPLSQLQDQLHHAGAVLVSYHVDAHGRLVAFVVDGDHLTVRPLSATVDALMIVVRRLDAQVARFRAGQAFADRWSRRLEKATTAILDELGRALLAPLDELLGDTRRLVVVPCRELRGVPFPPIGTPRGRVIDRFDVTVAPSASAWVHSARSRRATGQPVIIAAADDRAPHVEVEATRVAGVLEGSVLRGPAATSAAFLATQAPSVLHLACHGVFHPEHPMFSALRLADRWVTAYELADLDLAGSLVVLSACESGRLAVEPGEELMGLPRAALLAGARDVVTSSWIAHDGATAELMEQFAAGVAAGHDPSAALRRAQLALERDHPHPFYWAGFSVLGAGWSRPLAPSRTASTQRHLLDPLESIA